VESACSACGLKADGRIVELRDGREFPLAPSMRLRQRRGLGRAGDDKVALEMATSRRYRDLRRRARLTQQEFAAR